MANQRWTVIAIPVPGLEGYNLDSYRSSIKKGMSYDGKLSTGGASVFTKGANVAFVEDYSSIDQLIGLINSLLEPTDVLTTLEILAHSSPFLCDGVTSEQVSTIGMNLKSDIRKWDDNCFIYLTGCNTGNYNKSIIEIPPQGCIAQRLARAMWFDSPKKAGGIYHHHLIVYGSRGYLVGTHYQGDTACEEEYTDRSGNLHAAYDGAETVKKGHKDPNACYREFKNGVW